MKKQVIEALKELVTELFYGQKREFTWMVDNGPDQGILGTIAALSAEEASRSAGPGKNSIAAHVNHVLFGLNIGNAFMRGEQPNFDWESSWKVQVLDDAGWQKLQADLKAGADEFLAGAGRLPLDDQQTLTGCMASVGHIAYHLGAIRQLRP